MPDRIKIHLNRSTYEGDGREAEKAGYRQTDSQENFAYLKSDRLSLLDVDFMFVDRETLLKIMEEGERFKIAGQTFTVPSLYHLIALKLHSMKSNPKVRLTVDFPDIINLIRINKVNVKDNKFKELCLQYGSAEMYKKIVEAI